MKNDPVKVFISYSHKNREICDRIADIMRSEPRFDVWYDKGLVPGDTYRRKIVETIRDCHYFIVLLSEDSVRSEWVLDEVEYAKKLHKKILPVYVEETQVPDEIDMILQRYHSLFWHLRQSDAQFAENLMMVFGGPASGREHAGEALVGFGNEFSEKENIRMRELLKKEKEGRFAACYDPENACSLGRAYLFGGPCAIDRGKAHFYFKTAAYFGNADAEFYLDEMRIEDKENDTWDEADSEFAAPIIANIIDLAEKGSVPAKLFMGNVYWYGKYGCPVDIEKSASLYEECAKKGNARAEYMMAANYYFGDGVKQDYDLAVMYANLALEQKYIKSWRRWGKFYRDGLAVPQDYAKARECYEKGAQTGDYNCYNKVGDMLYFGWGFPVDYDTAFQYYLKGEQAPENGQKYGLWKAKQALGRCYELGHGVEKDLRTAAEKYLAGYRYGSLECRDAYIRVSKEAAV